jgi:hypothetical protein
MKYLLIIASLMIVNVKAEDCTTTSSADEIKEQIEIKTDVPKHLEGAKIIVRLADGRESEVPAERFKVVPRKQQFITTKVQSNSTMVCKNVDKNRVSALIGRGAKNGLGRSTTINGVTEVESNVGAVGGLQYQRVIHKNISVGVQGQTNRTGSVMLGIDF